MVRSTRMQLDALAEDLSSVPTTRVSSSAATYDSRDPKIPPTPVFTYANPHPKHTHIYTQVKPRVFN